MIILVVSYVLGDLVILRKLGNIPATIADANECSAAYSCGEWFFYKWLLKQHVVLDERKVK